MPVNFNDTKVHLCFLALFKDEVGLIAVNDAFVLEGMVFTILEKHLKDHPAYIKIIELFHQVRVSRCSSAVSIGLNNKNITTINHIAHVTFKELLNWEFFLS